MKIIDRKVLRKTEQPEHVITNPIGAIFPVVLAQSQKSIGFGVLSEYSRQGVLIIGLLLGHWPGLRKLGIF